MRAGAGHVVVVPEGLMSVMAQGRRWPEGGDNEDDEDFDTLPMLQIVHKSAHGDGESIIHDRIFAPFPDLAVDLGDSMQRLVSHLVGLSAKDSGA
jgi:hypothetical protein